MQNGSIVHLGPPKTATSYIQKILDSNRSYFQAPGRPGYLSKKQAYSGFCTQHGPIYETGEKRRFGDYIAHARLLPRDGPLLVTNEGILFDNQTWARPDDIEFRLSKKIARLKTQVAFGPVRIVVMVRDWAEYLASSYSEALTHHGPYLDFEDVRPRVNPARLSWASILSDLHDFLAPCSVDVFTYETFQRDELLFFQTLAGPSWPTDYCRPAAPLRKRRSMELTNRMFRAMEEQGLSPREVKSLRGQMKKDMAREGVVPVPFNPWSSEETKRLRIHYKADIEAVRALSGTHAISVVGNV